MIVVRNVPLPKSLIVLRVFLVVVVILVTCRLTIDVSGAPPLTRRDTRRSFSMIVTCFDPDALISIRSVRSGIGWA